MTYKIGDKEFEDWTEAQDEAVRLLNDGVAVSYTHLTLPTTPYV